MPYFLQESHEGFSSMNISTPSLMPYENIFLDGRRISSVPIQDSGSLRNTRKFLAGWPTKSTSSFFSSCSVQRTSTFLRTRFSSNRSNTSTDHCGDMSTSARGAGVPYTATRSSYLQQNHYIVSST